MATFIINRASGGSALNGGDTLNTVVAGGSIISAAAVTLPAVGILSGVARTIVRPTAKTLPAVGTLSAVARVLVRPTAKTLPAVGTLSAIGRAIVKPAAKTLPAIGTLSAVARALARSTATTLPATGTLSGTGNLFDNKVTGIATFQGAGSFAATGRALIKAVATTLPAIGTVAAKGRALAKPTAKTLPAVGLLAATARALARPTAKTLPAVGLLVGTGGTLSLTVNGTAVFVGRGTVVATGQSYTPSPLNGSIYLNITTSGDWLINVIQPVPMSMDLDSDSDWKMVLGNWAFAELVITAEADQAFGINSAVGLAFTITVETDQLVAVGKTPTFTLNLTAEADWTMIVTRVAIGMALDLIVENNWSTSISLTGGLAFDVESGADWGVFLQYPLPYVAPPSEGYMPGTINFHPNPGVEGGTAGWKAAAATVIQTAAQAWEGIYSVRVQGDGLAVRQGLTLVSVSGTLLAGSAREMFGSAYIRGPITNLGAWSEAVYEDGTRVAGEVLTVPDPGAAWVRVIAPGVLTDPAKTLTHIETHLRTLTAAPFLFWADGAQIEESAGAGATSWVSGAYGLATGQWAGPPNISISYRQPLARAVGIIGHGGIVTMETRLYRATWDNKHVEDISDILIEATASADATREITWTFDATVTWEGYKRLTPNLDWIAPVMTVTYPDGTVRKGQLGLYLVVPSKPTRKEYGSTVELRAFDPLWLMARQQLTDSLIVNNGTDWMRMARQLMDAAVLKGGDGTGPKRYILPDSGKKCGRRKEFPREENLLALANKAVRAGNNYRLWTTGTGIVLTRKRGPERIKDREPVRAWVGNVPDDTTIDRRLTAMKGVSGEVVGAIATTPKADDLYDEVLIVTDDPHGHRVHTRGKIRGRHGNHPRTVYQENNRRRVRTLRVPLVDDEDTAKEIAEALADTLSSQIEHVELSVLPDPAVELMHETVLLGIWDAAGDPVAVGQHVVKSVRYGFTPSSGLMQMTLSRVGGDDYIEVTQEG